MSTWTLLLRSLRFHWRSTLGVLVGAAVATAILVGALAVGDSVRYSLRKIALDRIGEVRLALNGKGRFFRTALGDDLARKLGAPAAPVILVPGTAASDTGERRAGRIQVLGVEDEFWKLGRTDPLLKPDEEGVVLNARLAERLQAKPGDEVVLRVDKPSVLSRDAPLSTTEDASVAIRVPVQAVATEAQFGRFSLEANQIPPMTAFVPLPLLQERLEQEGRANVLLLGGKPGAEPSIQSAGAALMEHWQLADASLELRELKSPPEVELRTDRVFMDEPVSQAAESGPIKGRGILSYFVNELRTGSRSTPYSLVTAMEGGPVPPDMGDDEVILSAWQAEDLGAKVGDPVDIRYFVVGPKRKLTEQTSRFRVRAILPMPEASRDRNLMPAFPGVADADNCRDWRPGIPIDLDRIRDQDEVYWDRYRGTPKAFLTLRAGQRLWNNRFGNLTAVRFDSRSAEPQVIEAGIRRQLNPASIGLFFSDVRRQALQASSQGLDFGALFIGFSFFLIVAALLLTALLFALGVEQRSEEVGTLLAVGFPAKRVRRLLLAEGAIVAAAAGVIGGAAGVLYTQAIVRGLSTVWSGAVAQSTLFYRAEPATLAAGALSGFAVALFAIWLVARRQAAAPARELLSAGADSDSALLSGAASAKRTGIPTALVCLAGALALTILAFTGSHAQAAGYFFGAGALLLISGIAGCMAYLSRLEKAQSRETLTLGGLGVRNNVRRRSRSLAAIALLACGSFLVVAVGANRHDPNDGADQRGSGTGGFALYAESTLPVYQDLNAPEGRDAFGLDERDMAGVNVVQMRLREGDEASCLNLNRAQAPRILGVDPNALQSLKAFTFTGGRTKQGWAALDEPQPDGSIPAIGDGNTLEWGLGKAAGDLIPYTDDRGRTFNLRIVGVISPSILQGNLIISERRFTELFPNRSGYQVFLIDAPKAAAGQVASTLNQLLEDIGFDASSAPERLALFNTVENTYLSIFAVLGGLGLLLGSVGLGVIVLRNVLERRGELGLLRAVGFTREKLHWLVFSEHSLLLGLGLLVGVGAALLAVLPVLLSPGADVPFGSIFGLLALVLACGFLWVWGATRLSLRGPLMEALRNE